MQITRTPYPAMSGILRFLKKTENTIWCSAPEPEMLLAVFFFMKQRIRNTSVSNNILPPKSLLVICGNARICSGLTETVSFPFRPRALQQRNISIKMFTNQDITAFSEIWKIIPYLLSQNGIWALTFTHRRALSMNQAEES